MNKFLTTIFALVLAAGIPGAALAQGGYYTWSISSSNADPFINTGAAPPVGPPVTFYLWFVEGCHPAETGGMAAAEFKVKIPAGWTFLAQTPMNGYLNAGPGPVADGNNFLLAVGSCPTGPVVASNLLLLPNGSEGRIGFTITDDFQGSSRVAGTVDCSVTPTLSPWPALMRCVGFATNAAVPNQDHGEDCRVTSVEGESWGKVKGLYR